MGVVGVLGALAFAALLARCAPTVGPVTMRAVVERESAAYPFAIRDDANGRSYFPDGLETAVRLGTRLVRAGDDVDLGYMQINIRNVRVYGLDVRRALDPCTNLRLGARILADDYARAETAGRPGQAALVRALSAYHAGRFDDTGYARSIYAIGRRLRASSPFPRAAGR